MATWITYNESTAPDDRYKGQSSYTNPGAILRASCDTTRIAGSSNVRFNVYWRIYTNSGWANSNGTRYLHLVNGTNCYSRFGTCGPIGTSWASFSWYPKDGPGTAYITANVGYAAGSKSLGCTVNMSSTNSGSIGSVTTLHWVGRKTSNTGNPELQPGTVSFSAANFTVTAAKGNSYISSVSGSGTYAYGSKPTVSCSLANATGYTTSFDRWECPQDGTSSTSQSWTFNMLNYNVTCNAYGKRSANSYKLTASAGTYISSVSGGGSKTYGSSVTVNCVLGSYTGYTTKFNRWTSSNTSLLANSTSQSYTFNMPAGNVTLTASATRTANSYTLTLSKGANISSVSGGGSKTYGSSVTASCVLATQTGYISTFTRWTSSNTSLLANSTNQSYTFSMPAGAVTLTASASLTPITYTVQYNSNGGIGTTSSSSHTYDVAKALTKNGFSRDGYTFIGWSKSSTATTATYTDQQSVSNLTSEQNDTVVLYAVWQANTYTVTFDPGLGSVIGSATKQVTYNSPIGTLPEAHRSGFDFEGWYTEEDGEGTRIYDTTIYSTIGNSTYYASWGGSGRVWQTDGDNAYVGSVQYNWNEDRDLWQINEVEPPTYPSGEIPLNGSGTEADPYQIVNPEDIQYINYGLDKCYIQANDLDLTTTTFSGIGYNKSTHAFSGKYDGNGKTVTFNIQNANTDAGFFKWTKGATITHLGILNSTITTTNGNLGALIGYCQDTNIDKCYAYSTTTINNSDNPYAVGGLIGTTLGNCNIKWCYNWGSVTNNNPQGYSGGIVGYDSGNITIENCYNSGIISGASLEHRGPIVGKLAD